MKGFLDWCLHPTTPTPLHRNTYAGLAAAEGALSALLWFVLHTVPYVCLPLTVLYGALAVIAERNIRREHRRTEGDREDHGAGTSAAGSTINVTLTGTADPTAIAGAIQRAFGPRAGVSVATDGSVLPVRESDEPIKAWKQARIQLRDGRPVFLGITQLGSWYESDDVAVCTRDRRIGASYYLSVVAPDHRYGPVLDCTCGFYALKGEVKPTGGIILEVELYGTVIVCEHGYRAERQRVLGVTLPKQCDNALCLKDATLVAFVEGNLTGLCDEHAALSEHSALLTPGTVTDLAGMLGTEVKWAS